MVDLNDPVDVMKDLIETNWLIANTDSILPIFKMTMEVGVINPVNDDFVLFYPLAENPELNSLGADSKRVIQTIAIQIQVGTKRGETILQARAHFIKVKKEVERILDNNLILPNLPAGYDLLRPERTWQDLSDKYKKIWKMVMEADLIKSNVAR